MISRKDIEGLAELSRLMLSEEELAALQKDFSAILEYIGQIESAAGKNALPQMPPERNVMRDDEVGKIPGGTPQSILAQAPQREGDYIVVRQIIHKDE